MGKAKAPGSGTDATKTPAKKSAAGKSSAKKKTAPASSKKAAGTKKAAKVSTSKSAAKTPAKKTATNKTPAKKTSAKRATLRKTSTPDKYSDPALRERIKAKVMREGKGGRPGQWSARKAQMVAHEYEAEGGAYKGGRDQQQKNLTEWTDEHWTTEDGKPARRDDGMHRYLPEKAWKQLTPAQKRSTEKKKLSGDRKGKQFVANTQAAVKARRSAERKG